MPTVQQWIDNIGQWLEALSQVFPLEWFVIIGGFIEELIGPIPSPLVMTLAGSLAAAQERTIVYIILLALLGGIGKTLGGWLLYIIGQKAEHWIVGKWGRYLGLSHASVEAIGKQFTNKWWDDFLLFALRAIPIMPSAPISVLCGVIGINMRTYLVSTFLGYSVRNFLFLILGFLGTDAYQALLRDIKSWEVVLTIVVILAVIGLCIWLYVYRKHPFWQRVAKFFWRT